MKKSSVNEIYKLLAELYWKAHGDGMVAASFGTDFGLAEVTISNSIVKFWPKQRTAFVLQRISARPNTRVQATAAQKASRRKQKTKSARRA